MFFGLIPLLLLSTCDAVKWVDYRLAAVNTRQGEGDLPTSTIKPDGGGPTTNKPDGPTPPGIVCDSGNVGQQICDPDCKRYWYCMAAGMPPVLLVTCSATETCNANVGGCSNTTTPECSPAGKLTFKCNSEGMFPDPANCKKYYHCVKDGAGPAFLPPIERTCNGAKGYHAGTYCCGKTLTNGQCPKVPPVPICKNAGHMGGLLDNPCIFHICSQYQGQSDPKVLYPYLFRCDECKRFLSNKCQ